MQNPALSTDSSPASGTPFEDPYDLQLCRYLQNQVEIWRQSRQPQLELFERLYKEREGIAEEGDTRGSGIARATKGKGVWILSTLNKVRTGHSKVSDAHRANGRYPYDVTTDHEELKDHALTMRKVQDRCLDESKFWGTLDTTSKLGATYGLMLIGGPFPKNQAFKKVTAARKVSDVGGQATFEISEKEFKHKIPDYRSIHPMDYIPDPNQTDVQNGQGGFTIQFFQPHELEEFRNDKNYRFIDYVLRTQIGVGQGDAMQWSQERLKEVRNNRNFFERDGRIVGWHFYGRVPLAHLLAWMDPEKAARTAAEYDVNDPLNHTVEAVCLMLGGVVVKAAVNQYALRRRPISRAVWEEVEGEFDGRSIALNNSTYQRMYNAATRLYFQAKNLSMLRPKIINPAMFMPNQKFQLSPDATWKLASWVRSQDAARAAYRELDIPDVSGNWREPMELADKWSDEATGQPKWAQGAINSSSLNPTATGIALIMGASELPLKQVMYNIDRMLSDIVSAQIRWTLEFLDPEVVKLWFGEEDAQRWAEMQAFGTEAWFKFRAIGAESFAKKQALLLKLQQIFMLAMSNPEVAKIVKWDRFFDLIFDSADLGVPAPVKSEDEINQMYREVMQAAEAQRAHELKLKAADAQTKLAIADAKVQGDLAREELKSDLQGAGRIEGEQRQIAENGTA